MLPFGSLAPGIFLPIFAFAYMLYFIAGACNNVYKQDKKNLSDLSPEKGHIITVTSDVSENPSCYFYGHKSQKPDCIKGKYEITSAYKQSVFRIIKIPDEKYISDFQRFYLFLRPPPFSV
jgi:hypothetical protein